MADELQEFRKFLEKREAASLDYVRGNAASFLAIVAHDVDASFFPPGGGHVVGTKTVAQRYETDVAVFGDKTESSIFEIFHLAADPGVAYWTGLQHAKVQMRGAEKLIAMTLRVTEVFRKEGTDWRLVHRHADMLSQPKEQH